MVGYLYDTLKAWFETLWGERIDYYALHPATVVQQRADGSLDVRADARPNGVPPALGDLTSVPIDISLPGAKVEVRKGSRVLVGFRAGDPQLRYAQLTSMTQVKSIAWESGDEFKCLAKQHVFDENGRGAARLGDLVAIGGGVYNPAGGTLCVIQITSPFPPGAPPPPFVPFGAPVLARLQFTPLPAVGAITTSKSSHKV